MDRGIIRTAKGAELNMTELKLKSIRPLVPLGDQKDKIQPQKQPVRQLNIQGFMPSMVGMATRSPTAITSEISEHVQEEDEGPSMADFTGITIESPRHIKEKPENPTELANETLREIMGDLNQQYSNRNVEVPTKTRRTKQT